MSNVIFYYTNPAKIDILISKLTQNLQQSIGVKWVFQHNFPKHSSYEERSTVREILHNNSASVVWHRLSFNLIELYITDVFSLSPDIDFLHAQLFYSYVCQSDDSHSNELLLLQWLQCNTIRLHVILLFYYNHHRIQFYWFDKNWAGKRSGNQNWWLKLKIWYGFSYEIIL